MSSQDNVQTATSDFIGAAVHASLPSVEAIAMPAFSQGLIQSKVMGNDLGTPALEANTLG